MSSVSEAIKRAYQIAEGAQNELVQDTPELSNTLSNSAAKGLPSIAIGPSQGSALSILCQLMQAKNILEIGTLGGYSTRWFAESSPDVKVTSIEFNPKHRDVALENLKGLSNVEVILGAALDVLPKLAEQGQLFDFIFIDADWDEQKEYFDWAVKLTKKGKCIYVDNVVRQLTEAESDGSTKGRALVEHVAKDKRVQASLIPTLNTHKTEPTQMIDGYLIAIKK